MNKIKWLEKFGWSIAVILVLFTYFFWAILKPLPAIQPSYKPPLHISPTAAAIIWPSTGQSAVSIEGTDILETHGAQIPSPMASTAKVITALMVLQKKPLAKGQTGPLLTITPDDVSLYSRYLTQDGSVLPVAAGEQLSEYQMLQALMLPSANNIADTLAIWAYGSLAAYSTAANDYLHIQGINNTHVGSDASGLSPDTLTTASNLVALGKLTLKQPVLSEIVSQTTATNLPLAPLIRNVNFLLGTNGIVGIKTGNSDQAGGVFLGAAKTTVAGKQITLITAVVGTPDLRSALSSSKDLVQSSENSFTTTRVINKGVLVGSYTAPWGEKHTALAAEDIVINNWKGEKIQAKTKLNNMTSGATYAGVIKVASTSVQAGKTYPVVLDGEFRAPSVWWRLTHPFTS